MAEAETKITISVPDSASAGHRVDVGITLENIGWDIIHAVPGYCRVNGYNLGTFYIEDMVWLDRGDSWTWYRYFHMFGHKDAVVHIESWWENRLILHRDTVLEKTVVLEMAVEVSGFTISDYVKV